MVKLLAISVGTPQEIDMNGKKVVTSILKNPVLGPVYIRKEGPVGSKITQTIRNLHLTGKQEIIEQ